MTLINGRDAAFSSGIGPNWQGVVGGYLHSPYAYHPWSPGDWTVFRSNAKIPFYVAGYNGKDDGDSIIQELEALGIPKPCPVAIDMEQRHDDTYLQNLFDVVRVKNGWKVLVYGSSSSVFNNPPCNGYIVAQFDGVPEFDKRWTNRVRAKQYESGDEYDSEVWKPWVARELWH